MPRLEWIGKDKIVNHHRDVPYCVLNRTYSYDSTGQHDEDNGSGNMVIHGDNLYVLKSLLPKYEGKIDLIYIDPPYNTGEEKWVYNDNVNDPQITKWLGEVVGKEGEDLTRHDKWLCMMYPRLVLLRNLLSPRGSIFISMDDHEPNGLRYICDEIFGTQNFVTTFIWRKVDSPNKNNVPISPDHEYVMMYAKDKGHLEITQMATDSILEGFSKKDENGRLYRDRLLKKNGKNSLRKDRPTMFFPLTDPDGNDVFPIHENGEEARWSMSLKGIDKCKSDGTFIWKRIVKGGKEVWEPYIREYAPEVPTRPFPTIWSDLPTMRQAKATLRDMFGTADLFDTPKPPELIQRILEMVPFDDITVLDAFAGSGATGHAVIEKNRQDGGTRRFVLIEIMDYADTQTAQRLKYVINGYESKTSVQEVVYSKKLVLKDFEEGNATIANAESAYDEAVDSGKYSKVTKPSLVDSHIVVRASKEEINHVNGISGDFSFYELGEPLLTPEGFINESVPIGTVREYVWYMETRTPFIEPKSENPYYLGTANATDYYFCYEREGTTALDSEFLASLPESTNGIVVYADICTLPRHVMRERNVVFKKIPREIPVM